MLTFGKICFVIKNQEIPNYFTGKCFKTKTKLQFGVIWVNLHLENSFKLLSKVLNYDKTASNLAQNVPNILIVLPTKSTKSTKSTKTVSTLADILPETDLPCDIDGLTLIIHNLLHLISLNWIQNWEFG